MRRSSSPVELARGWLDIILSELAINGMRGVVPSFTPLSIEKGKRGVS